jgi:hypothetical protein
MVERLSAAGQHTTLPGAIMITGTDDHDPPETMITIHLRSNKVVLQSREHPLSIHQRQPDRCSRAFARVAYHPC